MALTAFVSAPYTYTTGGVAAGVSVWVYLRSSTIRASLYRDSLGTIAPNPLRTDGDGRISAWIDPGDYDLYANGIRTPFTVLPESGGGGGSGTFVHDQSTPAATWSITHNLGTKPSVDVVDSSGNLLMVEVDYPTDNQTVITFPAPQAGTAYLRT